MLADGEDRMRDRDTEVLEWGRFAMRLTMRWYGWGSPVGLGLFFLLVAGAIALIKFAFR
jgi:hypothetical protein